MLFRKELKSYLAILRIKSKAFLTVAFWIKVLFLLLNKHLFIWILLPFLTPIYTKPTGFSLVLPLGPAIPVIETLISDFDILDDGLRIKGHSVMMGYLDDEINEVAFENGGLKVSF